MDPQADWEQKQSSKEPQRTHSSTSSEIDRQLVGEINELTGGHYTLEDLGLPQERNMFSDNESQASSETKQKRAGFQRMENLHIEGANKESFRNGDREINQSAHRTEPAETKGSPVIVSEKENTTGSIKSHRDETKSPQSFRSAESLEQISPRIRSQRNSQQTTPRSETSGISHHRTPTGNRMSIRTSSPMKLEFTQMSTSSRRSQSPPSHSSPKQAELYAQPKSPKGSNKPTSLLYVDQKNFLHPVLKMDDVDNLVETHNKETPLPPMPTDVKDALVRLEHIPVNQVTHFAHLGDYVRHLQANERICDVTIHIGTERYMAHRICLACYSDYFADIFYNRNDKQRVPLTVRLKGIKPVAFEILLKFIYTGALEVYPDVIGDLMTMAESLRIPMVKTRVIDYLECLPLAKALSILMKEKIFGTMYDRAMVAVCEQFNTFRQEEVFLEIEYDPLLMLLSRDNLNIQTEMDVFNAIVRWVCVDPDDRKKHLIALMRCVRFPYMTIEELNQCNEITDLVKENREVAQMLLEANWVCVGKMLNKEDRFHLYVPKPRTRISPSPAPALPLKWAGTAENPHEGDVVDNNVMDHPQSKSLEKIEDIMVIGGFNPSSSRAAIAAKSIERYCIATNEWKHFGDLPEPRLHYAACVLGDKIFITGGVDPRYKVKHPVPTADAFTFDTKRNSWIQVMKLNTPRMYHSMCSLMGTVYVIGGQDSQNNVLNSVECYNTQNDAWFYVKQMSEPRLGASTCFYDGKLFVVGGYGDIISKASGSLVLDTVESFNPRTNSWTQMNNLRFPRCHGNLVCCNGRMYLCGGATRSYNSTDSVVVSTASVDVYDRRDDHWEHCSNMVVPRHDAGAAVSGELIFIIGGCSTETSRILRSVECYDTATDSWVTGIQDLPYPSKWIKSVSMVN